MSATSYVYILVCFPRYVWIRNVVVAGSRSRAHLQKVQELLHFCAAYKSYGGGWKWMMEVNFVDFFKRKTGI